MPDLEYNVVVTGRDENAQDVLNGTADAMRQISAAHDEMRGRFQQVFTHIGVHEFTTETARAIGITGNLRPIIMGVNLAVNQLATAFGIASGPVGLLVMGFAAVAAVAIRVMKSHEKHKESLEQLITADKNTLKSEQDLGKAFDDNARAGGSLTTALEGLKKANAEAEQVTLQHLISNTKQRIAQEETASVTAVHTKGWESYAAAEKRAVAEEQEHQRTLAKLYADLEAQQHGYADAEAAIKAHTNALEENKKKLEEVKAKMKQHALELKQFQDQVAAAYGVSWGKIRGFAVSSMDSIMSGVSQAFAKMIVEGQSMSVALKNIFKSMEEAFIADIAQMILKWLEFQALTGVVSGGALSGGSANAIAGIPGLFKTAGGFSGLVTAPTLFLAGEAGPENVNISPTGAGAGGGGGGGGGTTVGPINIYGITDPRAIADQVGYEIMKRVRGRGELPFSR